MNALDLHDARRLRDDLRSLLFGERSAAAEFLLALSDFDARRGWEPLGHASLFAFLVSELRLSRSAAFWRLSAARLLQRFPEVIEPLRDGRLCVSTTAELAKVLEPANLAEVLPRYYGLSAREAAEVTASLQPRPAPPLRTAVTELPVVRQASVQPSVLPGEVATRTQGSVQTSGLGVPAGASRTVGAPPPAEVEPLTADLRRLHVTVSARLLKKVATARDGLSHSIPNASMEQVLEAALDLLLEKQAKARGQVKKPRVLSLPPRGPTRRPPRRSAPTALRTPAPRAG